MTDLWVAAAITADNEEVFEDWDSSDLSASEDEGNNNDNTSQGPASHTSPNQPSPGHHLSPGRQSSQRRQSSSRRSYTQSPSRPSVHSSQYPMGVGASLQARLGPSSGRRASSVSSRPAIFANTGLGDDISYSAGYTHILTEDPHVAAEAGTGAGDHLAPIIEGPPASSSEPNPSEAGTGDTIKPAPQVVLEEKPASGLSQLPMIIIFQYGLLALHNTTHDQLFLSYLVS